MIISIGLLISGKLGAIILEKIFQSSYHLKAVFTDSASDSIVAHCHKKNIPVFVGNPRKGKHAEFTKGLEIDVLLSVNYLFLIERDLIQLPKRFAINLHGSLLPKYRGRTPHVWAIINGEKTTGITAHLIEEKLDSGDIILQETIPIGENDTGGDILSRFNERYPAMVDSILTAIVENKVSSIKQDDSKASYFGKRTPADGRINWDWQKERIRNWVRAQANPYPGAFTYYKDVKVIVHQADYDDTGFHYAEPNGTILSIQNGDLIVKTPNGALKLSKLELPDFIKFKKGGLLT